MIRSVPFALVQGAEELARGLDRLATADIVIAIATAVLALLGIGIAVLAFLAFRAGIRTMRAVERSVERLAPRTEPLLEQVTRIATDAAEVSRSLRGDLEQLHGTIEEVNRQLRAAVDSAEERTRRFGAVVGVVQGEIEEILLDAAATARGVHAAAEAMRDRLTAIGPEPDED